MANSIEYLRRTTGRKSGEDTPGEEQPDTQEEISADPPQARMAAAEHPDQPDDTEQLAAILNREKTKRRMRPFLIIAGVIVLALGAYWYMFMRGGGPEPVQYASEKVTRGTLTVRITTTGELQPTVEVDVGSEVSGLIEEVLVDFNDEVKAGDVLARLDEEQLEAQVTQAEALLAQSQASLADARANYLQAEREADRYADLVDIGPDAVRDYERADTALASAKARLETAEAQVRNVEAQMKLALSRLEKAEIKAPIDGIVLDRLIEPGQTVAASFQTPHLFTIVDDLSRMELIVDIDEADIGQIAQGQEAEFTVDAYPDSRFEGTVLSVRNAPRQVAGIVSYQAVLGVSNADLRLKPGMTATADITVQTIEDVVLVPNRALRFTPPEKLDEMAEADKSLARGERPTRVWVPGTEESGPKLVKLETGATNGSETVVLSKNLAAGDEVLVDIVEPAFGE